MPSVADTIHKAFGSVPTLKADGTNYRTWIQRVNFAALGCACKALLTAAPILSDKEEEANALLAAIAGKLPDSIFMNISGTAKVPNNIIDAMKTHFGQTTAVSEASAQKRLFSLHCDNEKKMQEHLDHLLTLKEEIAEAGITIEDKTFTDAVIASVPASYMSIVQAYESSIHVYNATNPATKRVVKSTELLPLLRAEAQSRMSIAQSKPKEEVAAAIDSRGRRGKGRGRGGAKTGSGAGSRQGQVTTDANITCFKCLGKGHRANVCPSKQQVKKTGDSANVAQGASSSSGDSRGTSSGTAKPPATIAAKIVEIEEGWMTSNEGLMADQSIDEGLTTAYNTMVDVYDSGATNHM
ncbi:uncharacterized protein PHACADRAFT_83796, partial [Phanerochaete carnosa HHB-10118-sp]